MTDEERRLTNQVADLKRQLGAEREGRMCAEALLDDTRRANFSLRNEISQVAFRRCSRCSWSGPSGSLIDGEACPSCRLVL